MYNSPYLDFGNFIEFSFVTYCDIILKLKLKFLFLEFILNNFKIFKLKLKTIH